MKKIIKILSVLFITLTLTACSSPKPVLEDLKETYKGNTGIAAKVTDFQEDTVMDMEIDISAKVVKISMEEDGETFGVIADIGNNKGYIDFSGQWFVDELAPQDVEEFGDFFEVFDLAKEMADTPEKFKLEKNILIVEAPKMTGEIIESDTELDTLKIYVEEKQIVKMEFYKGDEVIMLVENIRKIDSIEIPLDAVPFSEIDLGF